MPKVSQIIKEIQTSGFELYIDGPRLGVTPIQVPDHFVNLITQNRDAIYAEIKLRERIGVVPQQVLPLREFLPAIGTSVRLRDGRDCLIWGVTCRGVIVLPDTPAFLITVDPDQIVLPDMPGEAT